MGNSPVGDMLSAQLVADFWDYCVEPDTISSARVNAVAEVTFLERVGINQEIATSTLASLLFYYESPLLALRPEIEAAGAQAKLELARRLHWHFRQRIRRDLELPELDDAAFHVWLDAAPRSLTPKSEPMVAASEADRENLSEDQAAAIADVMIREFPDDSQYIVAVGAVSDEMGFTGYDAVGLLNDPDVIIRATRSHLFGVAGGNDFLANHKVMSNIEASWKG